MTFSSFLQVRDDAPAAAPQRIPAIVTTALVVVSVVFPVLSAGSIYLRYLARRKSRQPLHADDAWIVISWILTLGLSMLTWIFTSKTGTNYFKPGLDPKLGTKYSIQLIWLSSCLVQWPLFTVKISILLFYKRIFSTPIFRICVWIAISVVTVWGLIFFFFVLIQTTPISGVWSGGKLLWDPTALGLAQVGSSIALDFIVLCFPLPVISRLQMGSKRKISVALIFWLGIFCCIAAAVRLWLLDSSIRGVVKAQDTVFNESKQFIFMILEPNCSIIAACLPCYGPLIAGGRAAESIIRSVRSVFSLRSIRSNNSGGSGNGTRNTTNPQPDKVSITDSQLELGNNKWASWNGEQNTKCVGGKLSYDEDEAHVPTFDHKKGISVTNGVTVTTSN
ncbi:hypothetical protein PT974_01458 [Cladobotryum mycophilum]|uniref:Rhodopsin domain-containing protein n=1 Tax=Cladobotryum mycophilum TaxID=491253 RepID=A0ABR0T3Q4_9HYPO